MTEPCPRCDHDRREHYIGGRGDPVCGGCLRDGKPLTYGYHDFSRDEAQDDAMFLSVKRKTGDADTQRLLDLIEKQAERIEQLEPLAYQHGHGACTYWHNMTQQAWQERDGWQKRSEIAEVEIADLRRRLADNHTWKAELEQKLLEAASEITHLQTELRRRLALADALAEAVEQAEPSTDGVHTYGPRIGPLNWPSIKNALAAYRGSPNREGVER